MSTFSMTQSICFCLRRRINNFNFIFQTLKNVSLLIDFSPYNTWSEVVINNNIVIIVVNVGVIMVVLAIANDSAIAVDAVIATAVKLC